MTSQALNSIELYRGNDPRTIERALSIQRKSVVDELMKHYNASNLSELAVRLSIS